MDPVVVYRTFDLAQAQLMKSRLDAVGIQAEVTHEHSAANLDVTVGGVRVVVPADKVDEARRLIESPSQ